MKTFEHLSTWLVEMSARRPFQVLVAWLVVAVLSAVAATQLSALISNRFDPPPTAESAKVARIVDQHFAQMSSAHLIVVLHGQQGERADSAPFKAYRSALQTKLSADPQVDQIVTPSSLHFDLGLAPDTSFMLMTFKGEIHQNEIVPRIRAEVAAVPDPAQIGHDVTDMLAIAYDIYGFTSEQLAKVERVGLLLSAVVLVYVFGGLFAASLPLLTGLLCITINNGLLTLLARFFETTTTNQFITAIIGLAIGIDYPLFLLSRVREELTPGVDPVVAFKRAVRSSGKAIGFSGLVVAVSTIFLALLDVSGLRPAALSVAAVVVTALALCYSFIPALLFAVGRYYPVERLLRRRFASTSAAETWDRVSAYVVDHPKRHLVISLGLLALLAMPILGARFWSPTVSMLPNQLESIRGLDLLAQAKQAGQLSPIMVTVEASPNGSPYDAAFVAGLYRFVQDLANDPRVGQVTSMVSFQPNARLGFYQSFFATSFLRSDPRMRYLVNDRYALLRVVPAARPDSDETRSLIADLRARIVPAHRPLLPGAVIMVGGEQAQMLDVADVFIRTLPLIGGLNLLAMLLILGAYFRSVFLPIKAVIVNMLPLVGAFGVVVMLFQHGWGASWLGIRPSGYVMLMTPAVLLTVLYALSMDYEVIILSRIKEAYDRTGDNRVAILEGLNKSGKVIVGGAAIMFSVFSAYVFADLAPMKEVGLGLAVAILIDATIVRQVLIPSAMMLMGRWNYWFPGVVPAAAAQAE